MMLLFCNAQLNLGFLIWRKEIRSKYLGAMPPRRLKESECTV